MLVRLVSLCSLLALLAACGGSSGGSGSGITAHLVVTSLNDDGPGSLRQTIADAPPGALITFEPAIHGGTIALVNRLQVKKVLYVDGGPLGMELVLPPGSGDPHWHVSDGAHLDLRSFTMSGGEGFYGASMQVVLSSAAVRDVRVTNGTSTYGGAFYFSFPTGPVVLQDVHVVACSAEDGGAVFIEGGDGLIERCSFLFNSATSGSGGAIHIRGGTHAVRNCTMHGNSASWRGGGIFVQDDAFFGDVHVGVVGCTITGSTAGDRGGGIDVSGEAASNMLVRQTIVAGNAAALSPDLAVEGALLFEGHYNLVGDGQGSTLWNGLDNNIVGDAFSPEDPMLDGPVVGPNGTLYRPSQPASPVRQAVPLVDSINEVGAALEEDQLGVARSGGGMADIGAVDS